MDESIRKGHYGLGPEGPPLAPEEVQQLPEGAEVVVIWSGGNGPHRYQITIDQWGYRCAWVPDSGERLRHYNPLWFVGQGRFHTRVWPEA